MNKTKKSQSKDSKKTSSPKVSKVLLKKPKTTKNVGSPTKPARATAVPQEKQSDLPVTKTKTKIPKDLKQKKESKHDSKKKTKGTEVNSTIKSNTKSTNKKSVNSAEAAKKPYKGTRKLQQEKELLAEKILKQNEAKKNSRRECT
ncbi:MAG: hypothetical protein LBU55_05815 [Elusimicrobiota bacterium]|jgi:hypothetical protein|nr:hypothetical protein [Elusimicrobiota bacterium]